MGHRRTDRQTECVCRRCVLRGSRWTEMSHPSRGRKQVGPGERLSFSLEGERTSQGHRLCSTCVWVAPAEHCGGPEHPKLPPPQSQDGRAPAHLTTPAEGEWDAGFGCSSLDPCSTPALSASARSRCPVTPIHMKDERRCQHKECSQSSSVLKRSLLLSC